MKKIISILALVTSVCMFMPSCVKEEQVPGGDIGGEEILPDPDGPSDEIVPDEQKVKLENVALSLMEKCPTEDFRRYFKLMKRFSTLYLENEDYDFSVLTDAISESVEKIWTEEEYKEFNESTNEYIRADIVNLTLVLSQHTGEFLFTETGVIKTSSSSDVLRVTAQVDSVSIVAELAHSGKPSVAFYQYDDQWIYSTAYGYTDPETGEWVDTYPNRVTEYGVSSGMFSIEVPENISITLVEDGWKSIADISLDFTKSFTAEGLDPSVDNFSVTTLVALDNGYAIESRKTRYDGSSEKAGINFSLLKDGEALVSSVASGDVHIVDSLIEYDHSNGEYIDRGTLTGIEVTRAESVDFVLDVLGEVQLRGYCADVLEFSKAYDEWDDACYDALYLKNTSKLDDAIAKLNSCFEIGVYYDNGSNRQAWIELEWEYRYEEHEYWTDEYYTEYPVIVFEDGSRYAWEEYFTEEAFERLMEEFEVYAEGASDLLGIIVED